MSNNIKHKNKDEEIQFKENEKEFLKSLERSEPIGKGLKYLLPHERQLLDSGELKNITHRGSSSVWLESLSSVPPEGKINVYRPMGDLEIIFLVENGFLPNTQPYQAIIEGSNGRQYANKYLTGKKWTDTNPSTIVEFTCPIELIEHCKSIQTKIEDGAISIGLGFNCTEPYVYQPICNELAELIYLQQYCYDPTYQNNLYYNYNHYYLKMGANNKF